MRKSKKTLKIDECLMLKKEKKTHQSPGSHQVPRLKLMKKEKIGQDFFFFFFGTVRTKDWSFGGW